MTETFTNGASVESRKNDAIRMHNSLWPHFGCDNSEKKMPLGISYSNSKALVRLDNGYLTFFFF